jgi:uncharacterized protein YjiS (DUF1127 family)
MLLQSRRSSIASTNVMEERSMRNVYREHPFETGADEAADPNDFPAAAQDARFADGNIGVPWQPHPDPAKRAAAGGRGSARASRVARGALSWLTTCAIEGFAAYAHSMYPCFVDPAELAGHKTSEQDARSHRQTADDRSVARQFSNPWLFDEPQGSETASDRSGASRFWFRMRLQRKTRLPVELDTLDEQTLKDVGTRHPDIERIVRDGKPYKW